MSSTVVAGMAPPTTVDPPGRLRQLLRPRVLVPVGLLLVVGSFVGYQRAATDGTLEMGNISSNGTFQLANDGFGDTRWYLAGCEADGLVTLYNDSRFALTVAVVEPDPEFYYPLTARLVKNSDNRLEALQSPISPRLPRLTVGPGEQFGVRLTQRNTQCGGPADLGTSVTARSLQLTVSRFGFTRTVEAPLPLPITVGAPSLPGGGS